MFEARYLTNGPVGPGIRFGNRSHKRNGSETGNLPILSCENQITDPVCKGHGMSLQ